MDDIFSIKREKIGELLAKTSITLNVDISIHWVFYDEIKITEFINYGTKGNGKKALDNLILTCKLYRIKRIYLDVYPQHDSNGMLRTSKLVKYYHDNFGFVVFNTHEGLFQMYLEVEKYEH